MVTPQVVEHVIHVNGLVDRPRRASLVVGKIRIWQVYFDIWPAHAVTPRQAQRVPEVRPEKHIHRFFWNLELRSLVQVMVPEIEGGSPAPDIIQRQQLCALYVLYSW
jgi:hypothetical protein